MSYIKPDFSAWTSTVVDYTFLTKLGAKMRRKYDIFKLYTHFNDLSDHLPMIIDINTGESDYLRIIRIRLQ